MSQVDPIQSFGLIEWERLESAMNGHSREPLSMAACRSENGRSDSAPQTTGSDPERTVALPVGERAVRGCMGPVSTWRRTVL